MSWLATPWKRSMTTGLGPLPCCAVSWCLVVAIYEFEVARHVSVNEWCRNCSRTVDDPWNMAYLETLIGKDDFSCQHLARVWSSAALGLWRVWWKVRVSSRTEIYTLPPMYSVIRRCFYISYYRTSLRTGCFLGEALSPSLEKKSERSGWELNVTCWGSSLTVKSLVRDIWVSPQQIWSERMITARPHRA